MGLFVKLTNGDTDIVVDADRIVYMTKRKDPDTTLIVPDHMRDKHATHIFIEGGPPVVVDQNPTEVRRLIDLAETSIFTCAFGDTTDEETSDEVGY